MGNQNSYKSSTLKNLHNRVENYTKIEEKQHKMKRKMMERVNDQLDEITSSQNFLDVSSMTDLNSMRSSNFENFGNNGIINMKNSSYSSPLKKRSLIFDQSTIVKSQIKEVEQNEPKTQNDYENFQQYFFLLPDDILYIIISFLMDQYEKLILISPIWYFKIQEVLENQLIKIDNLFLKQYMQILSLNNGYMNITPIKLSKQKGLRIDRIIVSEVLSSIKDQTVILTLEYQTFNQIGKKFYAEYKFDACRKKQRTVWIYKEDYKHNYDDEKIAYIQSIMPVSCGDNICISFNFFNLNGLVDLTTVKWLPQIIQDNSKSDPNRYCEVEKIYEEWTQYDYFEHPSKIKYENFGQQLILKDIQCSGTGDIVMKMKFIAQEIGLQLIQHYTGEVQQSQEYFGTKIKIIKSKNEITSHIIRSGLFSDIQNSLEMRQGDQLIFYLTKGQ